MGIKKTFLLSLIIAIFIANLAEAKSVYVITDHDGTMRAYEIQGNKLVKPYWAEGWFSRASDVTIDSKLKLLFITFEDSNIVWADAETLVEKGSLATPMMAGIVADEAKQRVYAVQRDTNQLYVCEWYEDEEELVLIDEVTLKDVGDAWGIALDKNTRQLYVGNNTPNVHYYDVDDPNLAHLGTRHVGRPVADVTVDPYRRFLYAGALYRSSGEGHNFLVKHDLEDPCESTCNIENNIGTVPIGVAVDPDSGLVYVTTSSKEIRVYDCSGPNFIYTDSNDTNGGDGPAGICVESALVELSKVDDINDCVGPGYEINYTIDYNYPAGLNCPDINDVNIIDYLPEEVDYNWLDPNSSDPCGLYDPGPPPTVTWYIGNLSPGGGGRITLTVKVNENAEPGGTK